MHALAAVPEAERHGPVAVDDAGNPFRRRYYNAVYRELADACSIPNGIWNMKARHGGATEARQSGLLLLARPERFELPTPRFVVWCSIQLSYGRGAI